ncbi:MAG: response regulator transcription factor [Nitrospirae bacterium]|nr:response regulator transcription factor [Nitrospirota bacterium]
MNPAQNVLVIDDDTDILTVLKANLEMHSYSVATASSWKEGKKALSSQKPDLIILDVMLPDGNGVEICRVIREKHPSIPIIMLTAKDKISDKVMGLESGADDYMVKPFETLELIARIKACLRRTQSNENIEQITIRDLSIDLKKRTLKIKNKEVILTPKEYALLCYLVNNRGSVITREAIRAELWKDSSLYSWSRVIDVHIQHLRQKIESNPAEPEFILTISGIGYRFIE